MFVVEIGSVITTVLLDSSSASRHFASTCRSLLWLWFTVLFANFAEAMAEGRGKAQAETLRQGALGDHGASALAPTARSKKFRAPSCAPAIWCSCRPANSFPETAKWSRASRRWMNRPSPASPRR